LVLGVIAALLGGAISVYFLIMAVSFERQWIPVPPDTLEALESGMTESQVRDILGAPSDEVSEEDGYRWVYERWWSWGYAVVSFDAEGKLTGYYQDDF